MREDGMETGTAATGFPTRPVGVIPEAFDEGKALATIVRSEERMRFDTRVDNVGLLGRRRLDLPDTGHRCVAALRKADRRLGWFGPGLAEIVGVGEQRPPVPGTDPREDSRPLLTRVDSDRVDL